MATTVQGRLDTAGYMVELTGDAVDPVRGSARVRLLVADAIRARRSVLLAPTGPRRRVDGTDPASIVALLADAGVVDVVDGLDRPDLAGLVL